jgi:hypothetical protein
MMLGLAGDRLVFNHPGNVFQCDELYFASFSPNLMPPSALIRLGSLVLEMWVNGFAFHSLGIHPCTVNTYGWFSGKY